MSDNVYQSAVEFLRDESIKDAPLDKKKEFLKSKGLSEDQIGQALLESAQPNHGLPNESNQSSNENVEKLGQNSYLSEKPKYEYYAVPPPLPRRDWKDYLIMATSTAGVLYGCYSLTKNHIIPRIFPKERSQLDQDKKDIDSKFSKLDETLEKLESQEQALKEKEEEKIKQLEDTLKSLTETLEETESSKRKMDTEFRLMKAELLSLQNTIDKFFLDSAKMNDMDNIAKEINSLKLLMEKSASLPDSTIMTPADNHTPVIDANNIANTPNQERKNKIASPSSVPSASDILSKMNLKPKGSTPVTKPLLNPVDHETKEETPAWLNARTENESNKSKIEIPEWQKNLTSASNNSA
ncbi:Peroxisomal membrane protein PEX14 [Hanseniaspora osmophila]|uniref:Peroxisomal membrane protein PEX14 n=1 Tax=Hanseniaspora osmophila TaxID=56408 RepID=A0A1E5RN60_9ASCO|nr:Peroxisomal membrane protein PEX14 [Hanseniaspora osmophila]